MMKVGTVLVLLLASIAASAQYVPPWLEANHPSPTADQKLLDIRNNGSSVFSADEDGDVAFSGTITGNGSGLSGVTAAAVAWSNISSRPSGLDDGDDDTTYTAGAGLDLSGTTFSIKNPFPLGTNDTTMGKLALYGGNAPGGGGIDFYTGAGVDDDVDSYLLEASGNTFQLITASAADLTFSLINFGIGEFDLDVGGDATIDGNLTVGLNDAIDDVLTLGGMTITYDESEDALIFSGGVLSGDGSGLTNLSILQAVQAHRVLEVSVDGNDTTAATGVGPFATVAAAVEYASTELSVSIANPVAVCVRPGEYGTDINSYIALLWPGTHIIGDSRYATTLKNINFYVYTPNPAVCEITDHACSFSDFRWVSEYPAHGFIFALSDLVENATVSVENVDFINLNTYAEPAATVTAWQLTTLGNAHVSLLFRDCTFNIQQMAIYAGHASVGSRTGILDVTMENCYIRSAPTGAGPSDPHFLINWWRPGTLTIKNSHLLYDLDNFTDSDDLHGLILMQNEDGNDYPSDGMQALNIYNSKLELRDNGLSSGYTIPIIQVNATSGKNRCTTTLEDVTLIRDAEVDVDLYTSNQSTVYYRGTNLIDWSYAGTAATVSSLSDGNKRFENISVGTTNMDQAVVVSADNGEGISLRNAADTYEVARLYSASNAGRMILKKDSSNTGVMISGDSASSINSGSGFGVGTISPSGRIEAEVGASDAVPALVLDQNDEDQPFISFEGTSASDLTKNITDADGGAGLMGPTIYLQVKINGAVYWIPGYQEP